MALSTQKIIEQKMTDKNNDYQRGAEWRRRDLQNQHLTTGESNTIKS
jgi:hypothetical protein